MRRHLIKVIGVCCILLASVRVNSEPPADTRDSIQRRRPVAIVPILQGQQLAVANRDSGTVSVIDLAERKVVHEALIGQRLSDLCATNDPDRLLATDEAAHQLIVLRITPTKCIVERRIDVAPFPVSVRMQSDGTRAFVASLWSRTLSTVDLAADVGAANPVKLLHLPFAPREQLVIESRESDRANARESVRLVVADSFGSKLAVINPSEPTMESVREFPAHAIRSLRLHPKKRRLLVTHQMLSRLAHTTFDDVHWGSLMVNCFRSLELADVLDPKADLLKHSSLDYLGGPERGAGDPNDFVINQDGIQAIVLAGTDELIVDDGNHGYTRRLKLGSGPTAIALSLDGAQAYVTNTLSDSVTIVQLAEPRVLAKIELGPQPEETSVDRGERLFHNARLSHDRWFSCASCHVDGHTNGLPNDNMTDGSFGTPKRVPTLRGSADTAPYAWNGRFATLSEQIRHSVKSTMQGDALGDQEVADLEAYLRTLPPPPPVGGESKDAITRGAALFQQLDCKSCHAGPALTSPQIVDVKLRDEQGTSEFNPPSLRGVSQNGPYFHDGRAATLDAVFTRFRHQLDRELSTEELRDLIAFLNSL